MKHHNRGIIEKCLDGSNVIALSLVSLLMIFPFYNIFVTSFTPYTEFLQKDLILWPKQWITESYSYLFSTKSFIRSMWVTSYVTVLGTSFSMLVTALMAYSLSRKVWGERIVMFMITFTFVFVSSSIPDYLIVKALGLMNSIWALILPAAINSFILIVLRQFFLNIPEELNDAALIDGANDLQIFVKIVLPLSKPALAALSLSYAVGYWNSYFNVLLYITDSTKYTVQIILRQIAVLNESGGIVEMSKASLEKGDAPPSEIIGMAAILVSTLPILIVYPLLQKHFVKGVMLGSVKG
jgi:putative aldouronate transport system permease protein